jgi:hypothetical protein
MTPTPHHWNMRWTPAQAASTLAKWRVLLPFGSAHKYMENATVFSQGDDLRFMFLLARGIVKLVFTFPDDSRSLLGLRYPGQLIGDWWQDVSVSYPVSASTVVPCEIHRFDLTQVHSAEQRDRTVEDFHHLTLRRDLCNLAATHLEMKGFSPEELLEGILWELAAVLGHIESTGIARLVLPLSNSEMADLCGLSESHYKEVRRELEATGRLKHQEHRLWILHRRHPQSVLPSDQRRPQPTVNRSPTMNRLLQADAAQQ